MCGLIRSITQASKETKEREKRLHGSEKIINIIIKS